MRARRHFLAGALAAALAVVGSGAHANEAAVRAAMLDFLDALNALDADRLARAFADDVSVFVPTAQPGRQSGKAAVMEIFRQYIDDTRKTTARTSIVAQDLRVEAGQEIGIASFEVRGAASMARRTFVFRRRGEAWLITHFHASNVPLAPAVPGR